MIVSEFIEWLKTQDQGATVEVLRRERGRGYDGDTCHKVKFDAVEHVDYIDLRGNPHTIDKPYADSRTLFLGED